MESGKRILLIDDEQAINLLISSALKMYNFDVEWVTSPVKALEKIKNEKCNLVISDIMMPEMDGLELVENIRKLDTNKDVPVILVSAKKLTDTDKRKIYEFKCHHIKKPFIPSQIINMVKEILGI